MSGEALIETAGDAPRRTRFWSLVVLGITVCMAAILLAMGRVPICECGTVKLWVGEVNSPDNSQHLFDWYTPSHVIHGFVFFFVLWLVARRWSFGARLSAATLIEAAWEIAENSPVIIDRYRTATIALDYYGDSVLNSAFDVVSMIAGFVLAARLPWPVTLVLALAAEVFVGWMIRDNLTLNVIMLLWPIEAIRSWQSGS
ncbi:DUF2585 domain-containing protein [Chthonobacter albigriseus]|uniref:DUF2585 domain-containing protein n=1 Tax=Chthonobacter albigriseus TaxID=1683161 RepID=UPI001FCF003C|nr:DUF2585 domain-containing protein [Chthonobacter albigriseus]